MTIEVRQMVIRSTVDLPGRVAPLGDPLEQRHALERVKAEILAECRRMLREQREAENER
ncbi:MAG: DUF5908 family protein [Betaproteobacteria bacterium]|jgi:hypothetical protein|nr:DUF5908 family protein [Betaproteobacteria bacterium]